MTDSLRLVWASPRYRGAVFAGTMADPANIKIKHLITTSFPKDEYTFTVTITKSGEPTHVESGIAVGLLDDTITVPITALHPLALTRSAAYTADDVPYLVTVELIRNAAATASATLDMHKYPAITGNASEVRYDDSGRLLVDGVPTAMYGGFCGLNTEASYSDFAALGLNMYFSANTGYYTQLMDQTHLDWGIIATPDYYINGVGPTEDIGPWTQQFRGEAKLLMYMVSDEPMWGMSKNPLVLQRDPDRTRQAYNIHKVEDPYHPVFVTNAWMHVFSSYQFNNVDYTPFTQISDGMFIDSYPMYDPVKGYNNDIRAPINQRLIMDNLVPAYQSTPEYNMLWEDRNTLIEGMPQAFAQGTDHLMPTPQEFKNHAYQFIVLGASSIAPWVYGNYGGDVTGGDFVDFSNMAAEIQAESHALLTGEIDNSGVSVNYTGIAEADNRIHWIRRTTATHEYILIINSTWTECYLAHLRDVAANVTVTFNSVGVTTVDAVTKDAAVPSSFNLVNDSMTLTLQGCNSATSTSGVVVLKRAFTPAAGSPPTITLVDDKTTQASNLPDEYPMAPFCSSNSGPLVNYQLTAPPTGFTMNSTTGVIEAGVTAANITHTITFSVDNDENDPTSAQFDWTITATPGVISLTAPYSQDITPTTATIGCTSDSLAGDIYAAVGLTAYTDKQILRDPNHIDHVWHGQKTPEYNNNFSVVGTSPEVPYHVGFYQEDGVNHAHELVDFRTDVGLFDFTRAGIQTGGTSDNTLVSQPTNKSVHVDANWDGENYTNTSLKSKGVLLEPAAQRLNLYQYTIGSMNPLGVTQGTEVIRGALTLGNLEETAATSNHEVQMPVTLPTYAWTIVSAIVKAEERGTVTLFAEDKFGSYGYFIYDVADEEVVDDSHWLLKSPTAHKVTDDLILLWFRFDSSEDNDPINQPFVGIGITDDAGTPSYLGEPPKGISVALSCEIGRSPTSIMLGENDTPTRSATDMTSTLTTLGFTKALNDFSFQLPIRINHHYDRGTGDAPMTLLTLGTGSNTLEVAIEVGGAVSLTKTYNGTAATPATVSSLTYTYGDRLNIRGYVSSTGGVKLWVNGASDTVADNNPFTVEPDDVEIHSIGIIAEQFRYKDTADDTEVGGWT